VVGKSGCVIVGFVRSSNGLARQAVYGQVRPCAVSRGAESLGAARRGRQGAEGGARNVQVG